MKEKIESNILNVQKLLDRYGNQKRWFWGKNNAEKLKELEENPASLYALQKYISRYKKSNVVSKFFMRMFGGFDYYDRQLHYFNLSKNVKEMNRFLSNDPEYVISDTSLIRKLLSSILSTLENLIHYGESVDVFQEVNITFSEFAKYMTSSACDNASISETGTFSENTIKCNELLKQNSETLEKVEKGIERYEERIKKVRKEVMSFSEKVDNFDKDEIISEMKEDMANFMDSFRAELNMRKTQAERKGGGSFFQDNSQSVSSLSEREEVQKKDADSNKIQ